MDEDSSSSDPMMSGATTDVNEDSVREGENTEVAGEIETDEKIREDNEFDNDVDDEYNEGGEAEDEYEFEIIDEIESAEEDDDDETGGKGNADLESEDGDSKSKKMGQSEGKGSDEDETEESEADVDDAELHAMLEDGVTPDAINRPAKPTAGKPVIKLKTVLREFDSDPFDILPEGWITITHNCGMPVYLHKPTKTCTLARPYSLGTASARTHDIPISAIPCLKYKKQLEKFNGEHQEQTAKEGEEETPAITSSENTRVDSVITSKLSTPESGAHIAQESMTPASTSACPFSHASSTSSPDSIVTPLPAPTRKMWMVAEESSGSFMKRESSLHETHEALHTGTENFSLTTSHADGKITIDAASRVENSTLNPPSPGEANIAISLDTSTSSPVDPELKHETSQLTDPQYDGVLNCMSGDSDAQTLTKPVQASESLGDQDTDNPQDLKPALASNDIPFPVVEESGSATQAQNNEAVLGANGNKTLEDSGFQGPGTPDLSVHSSSSPVIQEEASGNKEPSELVTSSSNSLASIKRKIESLKNRRGGKMRRLDNGPSPIWPSENNIAVPAQPSNEGLSSVTEDKIKAQSATVKIKSAEERAKESLLDTQAVHNYCAKLFQFKTIEVKRYSTWKERREHLNEKRKRNKRPELPAATKLITCTLPNDGQSVSDGGANTRKEFVLNPTGKSYLCILHEYMQRSLKIQPVYVFKEVENSKTPYGATVMLNNIEYGTGYASSKKSAKQEAAKETLRVLIPDLFNKISDHEIKESISDLSFFDDVKITDPRILDLGNKVGQPSPFPILLECLRRNFGMGNTQCETSVKMMKNQKCEFTINVGKGKHTATVVAKNKREGKQMAAQAVLAKLHPHVPSWGSLLRLYGTSVEKTIEKPKKMGQAKSATGANLTVLESLREEMKKLHKQKEAIQVKGKMVISGKDLPSKVSGVDL